MTLFRQGAVYLYSYLWAREGDAGEESGRKDRPACLLLRPASRPDVLILFAITSQQPGKGRIAVRLPASECARCNLREPTWIILDEYNVSVESIPHDFASLAPVGDFSEAFIRQIATTAREAITQRRSRGVTRKA